ncbi:MAG: hypothetical protein PHF70_15450 [Opitutales bacterium]|nr:hypothetical protein [Opitutales bacterium]
MTTIILCLAVFYAGMTFAKGKKDPISSFHELAGKLFSQCSNVVRGWFVSSGENTTTKPEKQNETIDIQ